MYNKSYTSKYIRLSGNDIKRVEEILRKEGIVFDSHNNIISLMVTEEVDHNLEKLVGSKELVTRHRSTLIKNYLDINKNVISDESMINPIRMFDISDYVKDKIKK